MMKYFGRMLMLAALLVGSALSMNALDKSYYAETSKLATGKWVKVSVRESGIYQITADDARNWGLGSDLSQIHVFGYGGAPLSETMLGDNYADDLPQMPLVRTNDRILFYAQGPITWKRKSNKIEHLQVQHPYALAGFYFVTNDNRFSDIEPVKADNSPTGNVITTYTERMFHEQDIVNPGEMGRVFLGESFLSNKSQSFRFTLDGMVPGSDVNVYSMFGAKTKDYASTISYSYNDKELRELDSDIIEPANTDGVFYNTTSTGSIKSFTLDGTNDLKYTVNYSGPSNAQLARLDFITVNYQRELALRNGSLCFGLQNAKSSSSYRISDCPSTTRVWDITAPFAPVQLNAVTGDGTLTFSPATSGRREFVAFDETGSYSHPEVVGEVSNQNIHGEPTPDMIIISPSAYLEQARRVASLHEQVDTFRVLVVEQEKVFNEFSSGTQDAMAFRRLCKMFYDRGMGEDGHKLGYLLLMGCGSYDNRMIGPDAKTALNYPHVLTWQSEKSNNDATSITCDDFFGILGDGSALRDNDLLSIAVGRMIVKSVTEARNVVNKLVKYVTSPIYGSWKNQVLMVADDGDKGEFMTHSKWEIASARANGGYDLVYNYVFIDAFNSVSVGGSDTYPDARVKMYNTLREGVLWWNYVGHSSTQNWTGNGLLMRSDVETQLFYKRLPVLFAATCEFTCFDNSVLSSGEHIFLNPNGGAVAIICPPRKAFRTENGSLSRAIGRYIFSRDEQGKQRRVGDMLLRAKNDLSAASGSYNEDDDYDNKRRFFMFGDPAMRLAYASNTARIESINGRPVDSYEKLPEFKAREQVEFSGSIIDANGQLMNDFNGAIISTLYGPEQTVSTHGNGDQGAVINYEDRPDRLAVNIDTVKNGRFTVRVIIPSEVNDNYRTAMINLYAYDSSDGLEAKGSNSDFYIHGYADEEVADTIGPQIITMGLNDEHFVNGSDINESPLLMATVSDESGVNFSSAGIGHSMTLTLDATNSYNDVASYYTPLFADEGTLGSINYQLNDLAQGPHTLRLRVWDVYNNMGEKTISFNVVKGLVPEIADVYCNNPASTETSFYVRHNRPDAVVSVTIEVYDLMGRLVWNSTQSGRSDMYTSTPITWDLTDLAGRRVSRGIYVYRAIITTDGVKEATKSKKLAVTGG